MSLHNVFRPEIFVIGGGISAEGEFLTNKIIECCEKFSFGYKGVSSPIITTAVLGNDAGIIGAYSLIK
jgi:glucokinase